ncbi:MAG: Gldg family protein [bacterium]|nr:hypothetical protein [Gemmatimonadota bacterium]
MGVTTPKSTGLLVTGLCSVFLGERVFHDLFLVRAPLVFVGLGLVVGTTIWSAAASGRAGEPERDTQRFLVVLHVLCACSLVGLLIGTEDAVRWLNLDFQDGRSELRFRRGLLSVSSIILAVSLLPLLAAQWAIRSSGRKVTEAGYAGSLRITETAISALSVALAGAMLMLLGYVTAARDHVLDASYFKTSTPGTAVEKIVRNMGEPLRVLLFFPTVDPVKDEALSYFQALGNATNNLEIAEIDRLAEPQVAEEYNVQRDGTIILIQGDRFGRLGLSSELARARSTLRVFDSETHTALLQLTRPKMAAYMTAGHGELNNPDVDNALGGALGSEVQDSLTAFRDLLGFLNYEVRALTLQRGLGNRVPDDAAMVLVIGPQRPFLDQELLALAEYLERGGSVLFALEPSSDFTLAGLRDQLGIEYQSTVLVDDQNHLRQRGGLSDRQLIVTDRFSSHAAVTTASRAGAGSGILLMGSGHLTSIEEIEGVRRSFIVHSRPSTFADLNGDFQFDETTESRGSHELAVAIEGVAGGERDNLRALIFSDAEMFTDGVLGSLVSNATVAADGIRWLGREEAFSGEMVSEEDVPIIHTRSQDVAWFYALIIGMPTLVLLVGLVTLGSRRRHRIRSLVT